MHDDSTAGAAPADGARRVAQRANFEIESLATVARDLMTQGNVDTSEHVAVESILARIIALSEVVYMFGLDDQEQEAEQLEAASLKFHGRSLARELAIR